MSALEVQRPLNYFRIAWQSALAASLCLGLPAGLVFWLIVLQRLQPFPYFCFLPFLSKSIISRIRAARVSGRLALSIHLM